MKIKTRPDTVGMLEGDELFQMNGWLAELRDEDRAEPWDDRAESGSDGRTGSREDSNAVSRGEDGFSPRDDGQAGPRNDGRDEPPDFGPLEPWDEGQAGSGENGHAEPRDDDHLASRDDDQAGPGENRRSRPRDDRQATPPRLEEGGRVRPRDDRQATPPRPEEGGRVRPRDDRQATPPRPGYPRPEASAATPTTRAVASAETTARAVIGDQLRMPITWCEMGSCVSWFTHPAALGEADSRARAIDAGWRVDAVGLLACPQCLQTAPGFQSPHPVVPWDGEQAIATPAPRADEPSAEAIATPAPRADEPSAEAIASVARELSHDLRRPVSSRRDEVAAVSAWTAAVPADDVARSASRGTGDKTRHPADDHESQRPGRHRKRLAARLMFASQ
jgi:hypothetical protein